MTDKPAAKTTKAEKVTEDEPKGEAYVAPEGEVDVPFEPVSDDLKILNERLGTPITEGDEPEATPTPSKAKAKSDG